MAISRRLIAALLSTVLMGRSAFGQLTAEEKKASVGDAPADPGPLATDISPALRQDAIRHAMRRVADWQNSRIANTPSRDWTFATLYVGMLAAARTLHESALRQTVLNVATTYHWSMGPRSAHADDQAIGQAYLDLYKEDRRASEIEPIRSQFDLLLQQQVVPGQRPVWWWCDALFMAPPVWAGLSAATHEGRYLDYMDKEWHITYDQLWDPEEQLFSRDTSYLDRHEKNGRKVFWSRGNGWVMGGLVRVLESMPPRDPRRHFYETTLKAMARAIAKCQSADGLWRAGMLDPDSYSNPEVSGSAFFVYALTWGMNHGLLERSAYTPVVQHAWAGILGHIYSDGRLGDMQPVGEAPGSYAPSASYVYGVGAFLLAGDELDRFVAPLSKRHKSQVPQGDLR